MNVYGPLVEVDALCRQQYVEPIHDTRLVEGAVRGMMLRLDPYSGYIAPHELATFERRSRGDYTGIGIEIGYRLGRLEVIAPIEGSPAAEAGVRPGDALLLIDGADLDGRSVFDVEEMLVGPPGSSVRLRILHEDEDEPIEIELRRDHIHVSSVRGFARPAPHGWDYWIDHASGIGYLRVSSFRGNTMTEFNAALESLWSAGLRGLIIDLRFNPGGIMHQAIAMVDRFVESGPILATVTRRRAVDEFRARTLGTLADLPLAILINGGSASASEIVAGSLQACGRAVVVGERSFGKGSVQHVIHLTEHNAALKLTTAYYRLPDGRIIHRTPANAATDSWGVIPDIIVELTSEEQRVLRENRRALDLAFVEDNTAESKSSGTPLVGSGEPAEGRAADSASIAPDRPTCLMIDRQLDSALNHLRGIISQRSTNDSLKP